MKKLLAFLLLLSWPAIADTTISGPWVASTGLHTAGNKVTCIFSTSLVGCVPPSGGGTTNFLRADGTWAAPSGSGIGGGGTLNHLLRFTPDGSTAGNSRVSDDLTTLTITQTVDGNSDTILDRYGGWSFAGSELELGTQKKKLDATTIVSAGTGYNVGDILTLVGGGFSVAAQIQVLTVDGGGGVTRLWPIYFYPGAYGNTVPSNPVSTTNESGPGTGLTVNATWTNGTPVAILDSGFGVPFFRTGDFLTATKSVSQVRNNNSSVDPVTSHSKLSWWDSGNTYYVDQGVSADFDLPYVNTYFVPGATYTFVAVTGFAGTVTIHAQGDDVNNPAWPTKIQAGTVLSAAHGNIVGSGGSVTLRFLPFSSGPNLFPYWEVVSMVGSWTVN